MVVFVSREEAGRSAGVLRRRVREGQGNGGVAGARIVPDDARYLRRSSGSSGRESAVLRYQSDLDDDMNQ